MKWQDDMDSQTRKGQLDYINARWSQLDKLNLDQVHEGVKYLFLSNAGGAVAMLTLLGSAEQLRALEWPWHMLVCFGLGIVSIGIHHFARYHLLEFLYRRWRFGVNNYFNNGKDWDVLIEDDSRLSGKFGWMPVFAYIAFILFITGVSIGYANYLTVTNEGLHMTGKSQTPPPKPPPIHRDTTRERVERSHVPNIPPPAPPVLPKNQSK